MLAKARRAVIRRGAPPEDAEDIVQEAFARLERYRQACVIANEEAFLMRAAVNLGRDQARRRKIAPFTDAELATERIRDCTPPADVVLSGRDRLRRATLGLAQLDVLSRRWLLAQRLEGLTFAEIARREGVPVTTVEKRVSRAVVFLVKWVDDW